MYTFDDDTSARIRALFRKAIALIVSLLAMGGAHAYQCGGGYSVQPSVNIVVGGSVIGSPADVATPGWLGGWTPYTRSTENYWCMSQTGDLIQPQLIANASLATPSTVNLDGNTYAVFKTGLAGVGVVLSWHPVYGGAVSSSDTTYTGLIYEPTTDTPLTLSYTPVPTALIVWNRSGLPQIATAIGISVKARFVKIGTVSGGTLPAQGNTTFGSFVMGYNYGGTGGWAQFGNTPIGITVQSSPIQTVSCTVSTPNFTVALGTYSTNQFTGIGSTVGGTAFAINLTACPASMTSITYNMAPVNGATGSPGVIRLQPVAGAATGVGILIADGSGTPVSFSTDIVFTGYTGAAGNYQIPFQASFQQTAASVTSGPANAQINYTIKYN